MARKIEMDHKARIAWVKSGDHAIASFDFDHWGGANKAQMAAENYIETRHENPWEMADRIEALEAANARLREVLKEAAGLLKKDARDMATALGVTEWRETAPYTADIVARARAALKEKNDD